MATSFEEYFEENGTFIWVAKGDSMRPLIREKIDAVVLKKPEGPLRRYDIALYDGGSADRHHYVLHRVIGIDRGTCRFLGDNSVTVEVVPRENVVAVLTGLSRNGKPFRFRSLLYKVYMLLWVRPWRLRRRILIARGRAAQLGAKIRELAGRL